tara:strand:- start:5465 stop:6724 length:1260 start_codon:yes stop_codon:yes gene_type:complete
MNIKQLRKLVVETIREEQTKGVRKQRKTPKRNWDSLVESAIRKVLIEGEEDIPSEPTVEDSSATDAPNMTDETNTKAEFSTPLINAMFDNVPLFKQMMADMGADWGLTQPGEEEGKNGPPLTDEEIAATRDEIFGDKATAQSRMDGLNQKLAAGKGFSKAYMPAFEGVDAAAIADALDATIGNYGVDHSPEWNETQEFEDYWSSHQTEYEGGSTPDTEQEPAEALDDNYSRYGSVMNESIDLSRWNQLAGLLNEEFSGEKHNPFPGPNEVMPGAPNKGDKAARKVGVKLDDTAGKAKAYLEKGKKVPNPTDKMSVETGKPLNHNDMTPTQREVKLGKTIAFAFKNIGKDMGGSFADNEGNILDGHHRWSGQEMRGFDQEHQNVNIIHRGADYTGEGKTKEFLKMLSTLSTAIGRPTKLK